MKGTGCGLGVLLLLLAAASALAEIVMLARAAQGAISLGWLWFQIHGNSLVGFQALIEKGVSPAAWPPIQSLLTWPLWLVLGIPGVLLGLFCLRLRRPDRATG
jgi:hypothetical protein